MEKLLTTLSAVGFVLVLVGIIYGTYANEYWKLHKGSEKYAGGFKRAILGIAGWVAIICLMCHQFGAMVVGLLIPAALLALTGMAMQKDGIQAGKYILLVFFASLGTYVTRSGETFRLQNDSGDNATYYCPRTGETVHLRDTDFGRYD